MTLAPAAPLFAAGNRPNTPVSVGGTFASSPGADPRGGSGLSRLIDQHLDQFV
jgi:hypothetical protein